LECLFIAFDVFELEMEKSKELLGELNKEREKNGVIAQAVDQLRNQVSFFTMDTLC